MTTALMSPSDEILRADLTPADADPKKQLARLRALNNEARCGSRDSARMAAILAVAIENEAACLHGDSRRMLPELLAAANEAHARWTTILQADDLERWRQSPMNRYSKAAVLVLAGYVLGVFAVQIPGVREANAQGALFGGALILGMIAALLFLIVSSKEDKNV